MLVVAQRGTRQRVSHTAAVNRANNGAAGEIADVVSLPVTQDLVHSKKIDDRAQSLDRLV
jgi:hypothetical protein